MGVISLIARMIRKGHHESTLLENPNVYGSNRGGVRRLRSFCQDDQLFIRELNGISTYRWQ
jgi:hypothetical protein